MDESFSLDGKTAIVCGATQGIGRAIAHAFARAGARVVAVGRNEDGLRRIHEELLAIAALPHETVAVDFSKSEDTIRVARETAARLGSVHILVNNTGGPAAGALIEANPNDFAAAIAMHVGTAQAWTQACAPLMRTAGYGRIISITSTSVVTPIKGLGVSNTVRAAMGNWTKTLAQELGRFNITVNAILPGFTRTLRLESLLKGKAARAGMELREIEAESVATIPLGRFAEAEEIARVAVFLASPAASYVNGVNLPVDGGRLATQ
ncbi:MAG: SDR family oxidoreductase [Phycisphaerales bacterium]|nr:SDR family oxidoreductase [Phycisphaerales bacterium]